MHGEREIVVVNDACNHRLAAPQPHRFVILMHEARPFDACPWLGTQIPESRAMGMFSQCTLLRIEVAGALHFAARAYRRVEVEPSSSPRR